MAWGLPPTFRFKKKYRGLNQEKLSSLIVGALKKNNFEISEQSRYQIIAFKKMKYTVFSLLNFTRPKIKLRILVSDDTELTIEGNYVFSDYYTATFFDFGKTKKEIESLINKMGVA